MSSTVGLAFIFVWAFDLNLAKLLIFRRQNRADESVAPQPQPVPINDNLERGTCTRLPGSDGYGPIIPNLTTDLQLGLMVIRVCFAAVSAAAALQAHQALAPLPGTFPWFCLTFKLAFVAYLVSSYIRRCYKKASPSHFNAAILFGAVAFLLAIFNAASCPMD